MTGTDRNRTYASLMYAAIEAAPMGQATRSGFVSMAQTGDCDGIYDRLRTYIDRRPDVGASVQEAGKRSFEAAEPEVRLLHEAWRIGR